MTTRGSVAAPTEPAGDPVPTTDPAPAAHVASALDGGASTGLPRPARTKPARESSFSALKIATIAVLAVGLILLLEVFAAPAAPWGGRDNPGGFGPPRSRAEHLVAKMDGHTFAEIALDPTMADSPKAYFGDKADAAYRSSRPMMGWVDYVASAGAQRSLLAPAILVVTALTVGAALLAIAGLGVVLGRRIRYLGAVMVTPAFFATIAYPGICEPLAIALACAGITAWIKERTWLAVGLLTAAALTRETMLIVALGLGIAHLIETRRPWGALKLAIPALAYGGWITLVHARLHAWPSDYSQTSGALVGFRAGFPHWHPAEWAAAALLLASFAVIAAKGTTWMRVIAVLHLPLLLVANYQVWWVWLGYGRVTMLLPIFALIAISDRTPGLSNEPTEAEVAAARAAADLAARRRSWVL